MKKYVAKKLISLLELDTIDDNIQHKDTTTIGFTAQIWIKESQTISSLMNNCK